MTFDSKFLKKVRKEFPTAEMDPTGRSRAFLDNGAGTLVCRRAADAERDARVDWSANVGNYFTESKGASDTILEGRKAVSDFLRADGPESIISGESCTSLIFNLSYAISRDLKGEENIVLSGYEHYANVNPWAELGGMHLIKELRLGQFDLETGVLDMENMKSLIDKNTKVVSVTAASNVLGTKTEISEVAKMAHEVGALFGVDAVHHVAHGPTDVIKSGCDFLVFSGYKLFSRHGSFMYLRPELIEKLRPYKVDPAPKHGPEKWEQGTRDQAMFAAIRGVIDYFVWLADPVAKEGPNAGPQRAAVLRQVMQDIEDYERDLSRIALDGYGKILGLRYIPGLTLYGPKDAHKKPGRDPTFALKLNGWDDHELSKELWDRYALAVGAEDFYSMVPAKYKAKTVARATFVHYNTKEEVIALLKALNEIAEKKK